MDLMGMLKGHFDEKQIQALADKVGASTESVQKALDTMLPSVMGGLSSKLSFLDKDGDGDIMDDVKAMFGMGDSEAPKAKEVLDDKAEEITTMVSKSSGLAEEQAKTLLDEVTAKSTGFLGGLTEKTGIDLGGLMNSVKSQGSGMLDSLDKQLGGVLGSLDKDGDGSVVDDVQDMAKGLLGGLFGKK